ncbi:uncharacterized protein LOC135827445 isoform X2 [Sycon ciliatum]|uniref:uncharacterized protein LOC135827445 isoform X2 n=1 Tax=Sycon ciliatum TaxID=27933 RepID=UPI0031F632BC|eukprot:scpid51686/ scgid8351/ 
MPSSARHISLLLFVYISTHDRCTVADVISAGCNERSNLEHVYIEDGGATRYQVRASKGCSVSCAHDPHTPPVCPPGFFEKEFAHGCQHCLDGCPTCTNSSSMGDCVLHKLFPNQCRYPGVNAQLPDRRFYRIRHCEKCHESCAECTGPLATDCTRCPASGEYWPVNKQCLKIRWHFTHGSAYQCFLAGTCFPVKSYVTFVPLQDCSRYEIQLFDDQKSCVECNSKFCHANCSSGALTAECAFRDLGNGYHCSSTQFKYLPVQSRACIDRVDACASSPCLEDYMCRSTLDWQGYACDCRNTTDGPLCPKLTRPHPKHTNVPAAEGSGWDVPDSNATESITETKSTPDPQPKTAPQSKTTELTASTESNTKTKPPPASQAKTVAQSKTTESTASTEAITETRPPPGSQAKTVAHVNITESTASTQPSTEKEPPPDSQAKAVAQSKTTIIVGVCIGAGVLLLLILAVSYLLFRKHRRPGKAYNGARARFERQGSSISKLEESSDSTADAGETDDDTATIIS